MDDKQRKMYVEQVKQFKMLTQLACEFCRAGIIKPMKAEVYCTFCNFMDKYFNFTDLSKYSEPQLKMVRYNIHTALRNPTLSLTMEELVFRVDLHIAVGLELEVRHEIRLLFPDSKDC
jgi:hypothetical protein